MSEQKSAPVEAQSTPQVEGQPVEQDLVEQSQGESEQSEAVESLDLANETEESIDSNPNLTKAEKKEAKKAIRALKYKVDGEEIEEELPFDLPDDPAIVKYLTEKLQLAKVSKKRIHEKGELSKQVGEFLSKLQKNPFEALSDPNLGIDVEKEMEKYLQHKIEQAKKSPEQIEKEKLQEELRKLKEEREAEKRALEEKERSLLEERAYQKYEADMTKALETSGLPKSPYTVKKVAEYLMEGVKAGLDVNVDDIIPLVKEEMSNDLREMFSVMPEELVESIVGKQTIDRIRKKNIQRVKKPTPTPATVKAAVKDTGNDTKAESPKQEKKTFKQFFGRGV